MAAFSPTDAAFEGFRLTREQPRVVAVWAGLFLVFSVISALLMVSTVGPQFAALQAASQNPAGLAPADAVKILPFYALVMPVVLVFWSVLLCAVYRAVLRPAEGGLGALRFGVDELRMIALTVILWMLMFFGLFMIGLVASPGMAPAGAGGVSVNPLGAVGLLAGAGAAIWAFVRLSLAAPMTFVTGELHLIRAWTLTRGQFWRLLGAYVLALGLAGVVAVLALVIFTALAGVAVTLRGGAIDQVGKLFEVNPTSMAAFFSPAMIVYQLFTAALQAVLSAVVLAPAAVAYAALSPPQVSAWA